MNRCLAAFALAVSVSLLGCGEEMPGSPRATATTTTFRSMPAGEAAIEPGSYRIPTSAWNIVDFTVTFPAGWTVGEGHVFNRQPRGSDEFGFYAVVLDEVYDDPCHGEGGSVALGPRADDLVTALRAQPGLAVSEPVDTSLGGHPVTRIDLKVRADFDLASCRLADDGILGLQVWHSAPTDKFLVLAPGETVGVYILDVATRLQVFVTSLRSTATDAQRAELQAVLDSIQISA